MALSNPTFTALLVFLTTQHLLHLVLIRLHFFYQRVEWIVLGALRQFIEFNGGKNASLSSTSKLFELQNMENQKKQKRVDFSSFRSPAALPIILSAIQQGFSQHGLEINSEFNSQTEGTFSSGEIKTITSLQSHHDATEELLIDLQSLLVKELANSLADVMNQVFDRDREEKARERNIFCMSLIYAILKTESVNDDNCSKLLKWVHDLTGFYGLDISLELCTILESSKKRLLRFGFSLLKRIQKWPDSKRIDGNEEQFKEAVQKLIQQKEKQISGLQFQLCRVCEAFVPLTTIAAHVNQCERLHQMQYLQSKLQDRGAKILNILNQLRANSEEKYNLRLFFDRIFKTIGDVLVTFGLKDQPKEVANVIEQYKGTYVEQSYNEVIQLLQSYHKCFQNDADFGETLSDKDSKQFRSKKRIRVRNIGSNTSLIPSFRTVDQQQMASESQDAQEILSEKTINTDTEAMVKHNTVKLQDFQVLQSIGKGSYSEVYLVRKRNTKDLFAMKVIEIEGMDRQRIAAFKREQKIYKSITGGFNVKLYYSFSINNLYFLILDYGCGGSFRQLLTQQVYLEQRFAKVYIANLILAVDSIHRMGIVHRDLKPDNIVINELGQLILTDFNLSKLIKDRDNERSNTFFGTPDYIAPQVLKGEQKNQTLDYFSVGVIAYEMVIGVTPYTGDSPQEVFENILEGKVEWPEIGNGDGEITQECKSLLEGLLEPDPKLRLGANGLAQLQAHPFFQGVNWTKISQCQFFYVPPSIPQYQQNFGLLMYIQSKMQAQSEKAIEGETIVRYDILKSITNKNVRSHRNSRFKLEKELSALKILPSMQSVKIKKHSSYNNFNDSFEEVGISCKDFFEEPLGKETEIA